VSNPRNTGFAWLRTLLVIVYLGIIAATVVYERNAHEVLSEGHDAEAGQQYVTANMAYMIVIERFPLSYAVIDARNGLNRIEPALENNPLPKRLGTTFLEDNLGKQFDPYFMYWVPFIASIVCAATLFVVFFSRLRRPGLAFVVFILLAVACAWSVVQLVWYGFFNNEWLGELAEQVMAIPILAYCAGYALIVVTAIMTLKSPRLPESEPEY
jgi:hypothetical protein